MQVVFALLCLLGAAACKRIIGYQRYPFAPPGFYGYSQDDDDDTRHLRRGRIRKVRSPNNGRLPMQGARTEIIKDWINQGWIYVPFGNQGTTTFKTFIIRSRYNVKFDAVDLFCTGDRFRIEFTPMDSSEYGFFLVTTEVAADGCQSSTPEPDEAWKDGLWSSGSIVVPAGHYRVKIFVESSLYGGGTMAIRARTKK